MSVILLSHNGLALPVTPAYGPIVRMLSLICRLHTCPGETELVHKVPSLPSHSHHSSVPLLLLLFGESEERMVLPLGWVRQAGLPHSFFSIFEVGKRQDLDI